MVKKLHQRKIRYLPRKRRKPRQTRPKSFKSEESATKWAEAHGIKNYSIIKPRLGLSNKFIIKQK